MLQSFSALTLTLALISVHGCGGHVLGARGAFSRSLERKAGSGAIRTLERDLERDRATAPRLLQRDRVVNRYTTLSRARIEARRGIAPGTHMTTTLHHGRPLSSIHAQARYGLPERPNAVERILVKQGTKVRINKALGGEGGFGEITLGDHSPKQNVVVQGYHKIRQPLSKAR